MASKAGYIITLIGGILQLISGIVFLAGGSILSFIPDLPNIFSLTGWIPGVWFLIAGILTIWASMKMNMISSREVRNGGIIALITGILAPNIVVVIGAIIALVQSYD